MALDRSKFKASIVTKTIEQDKEASKITGKAGRERAGLLELEVGRNRLRIYPAHPDNEDAVYAETLSTVYLPAMVVEKDDKGNEIFEKGRPKMKRIMKQVFNSKLHGTNIEKDLVEEYIRMGKEVAADMQDKGERQKYLDKLYGKYNENPALRLSGCNYQNRAVMYADKLNAQGQPEKFGRLELKTTIKQQMNDIAALEANDDPLGVDPFSDPESGLPIIITVRKPAAGEKLKPADYYKVTLDKDFDKAKKTLIEHPISDERLEAFLKYPSLQSLYKNVFKKRDFELQLSGLEMFDKEHDMGIFETEEFISIAEEIATYFADEEDGGATIEELEETFGEEVEELEEAVEQQEAQDEFDLMTRVELKNYIVANKLKGIVIRPTNSEDEIRNMLREKVEAMSLTQEPLPGEEVEAAKPVVKKITPTPTPTTSSNAGVSSRLKNLQNSINKK